MYFSRMKVRSEALTHPDFKSIQTSRGYPPKKLAWEAFGDHPDRDRDFIYRPEGQPPSRVMYAVSERPPEEGELFRIQTKDYDPSLSDGQVFDFKLRANATIHKDGKDHDVVMNAKWEMRNGDAPERPHSEIVQEEGWNWLDKRGEPNGFEPVESATRVEGYRKLEFQSSGGGHQVVLGILEYTGRLRVSDPEAFRSTLFEGLGPSKAYGCGLMLVRPPKTPR
jgi:CRISPR system Cascade subunit CasE